MLKDCEKLRFFCIFEWYFLRKILFIKTIYMLHIEILEFDGTESNMIGIAEESIIKTVNYSAVE